MEDEFEIDAKIENNTEMEEILKHVTNMDLKKQEIHTLEGVSPDVEFLLMEAFELRKNKRFSECVDTLQAVLDVTWEELNTGHWSLVPDCQRVIYSVTSLLKVLALVEQTTQSPAEVRSNLLEKAVKAADMGLLLGNSHRDQLSRIAHLLSEVVNQSLPKVTGIAPVNRDITAKLQVPSDPVSELHCASLETFSSQYFHPRRPVKIKGCMNHWPALRRWANLDYLQSIAGSRTVPVELGSSYTQSDWSQRLMTLQQFITQYICNSGDEGIGYLAQHQLFDQVPELKEDILVPDYCACTDSNDDGEGEIDINAWFGPAGTVSALHHDPKHNLLCQVVGSKRVTLYAPSMTDRLYPHEGRLLFNTAQVDPENPDYKLFPKYRNTQAYTCLLLPGEMLYIPPTWWHHVRALDLSFSVSFWWT